MHTYILYFCLRPLSLLISTSPVSFTGVSTRCESHLLLAMRSQSASSRFLVSRLAAAERRAMPISRCNISASSWTHTRTAVPSSWSTAFFPRRGAAAATLSWSKSPPPPGPGPGPAATADTSRGCVAVDFVVNIKHVKLRLRRADTGNQTKTTYLPNHSHPASTYDCLSRLVFSGTLGVAMMTRPSQPSTILFTGSGLSSSRTRPKRSGG